MLKRVALVFLLTGAVALSLAASHPAHKAQAAAAGAGMAADHHTVKETEVQWGPAPPVFSPGAQMAVMDGNPGAAGTFIIRLKMPAGYKIMPHWHLTQENVTVISGTFQYGMGDKMTPTEMTTRRSGRLPSRRRSRARAWRP